MTFKRNFASRETKDALNARPETGWLIERRNPEPEWLIAWSGGFEWTKDSLKAIRFCRREDANQIAEIFEFEDIHVTEHQWG